MMSRILMTLYNTMSVVYVCTWAVLFISVTTIEYSYLLYKYLKQKYARFRRRFRNRN